MEHDLDSLIRALTDSNPGVRSRAAGQIAALREPALAPLFERLKRCEAPDRSAAVSTLGELRAPHVFELMVRVATTDRDEPVRIAAIRALGRSGDWRAVAALGALLRSGPVLVRVRAAEALAELGDPDATPHLLVLVRSIHRDVQVAAIEALGWLRAREAVPALIRALTPFGYDLRGPTVAALGRIGDPAAIAALCQVGASEPPWLRAARSEALAGIGAQAVPALLDALDGSPEAAELAADALAGIGRAAVQPLCAALNVDRALARSRITAVLGRIGDPLAFHALRAALRDPHPGVRGSAALALAALREAPDPPTLYSFVDELAGRIPTGASGEDGRLPLLGVLLHDPASAVRVRAALALAALDDLDPARVPVLVAALADKERPMRIEAARTLARTAQRFRSPALRTALAPLRRAASSWVAEPHEAREYADALRSILAVTEAVHDLPVPAGAAGVDPAVLPIPAREGRGP